MIVFILSMWLVQLYAPKKKCYKQGTSHADMKSRLDQDYDPDVDAKAAAAQAQAHPQTTTVPKKAKKTTSDLFAAQLLQALTESQATAQQILHDKLEITTLVQGSGKTEINESKLKKFTKEDYIKFSELYDVYIQNDGRDSVVVLIPPTSLGYAAFLCKFSKDQLLQTRRSSRL